jgi:hypothetical protein
MKSEVTTSDTTSKVLTQVLLNNSFKDDWDLYIKRNMH